MTFRRSRLVLLAAVGSLAIASCAVPGQGTPGVAASYQGQDYTTSEVQAASDLWRIQTEGKSKPNVYSVLTMDLVREQVLKAAADLGYPATDEAALNAAKQWLSLRGPGGEPSAEFVEEVKPMMALFVLMYETEGFELLQKIAQDVEDNAVVNPRYGKFDADVFLESAIKQAVAAENQELGAVGFVEFAHVSGFDGASADWVSTN